MFPVHQTHNASGRPSRSKVKFGDNRHISGGERRSRTVPRNTPTRSREKSRDNFNVDQPIINDRHGKSAARPIQYRANTEDLNVEYFPVDGVSSRNESGNRLKQHHYTNTQQDTLQLPGYNAQLLDCDPEEQQTQIDYWSDLQHTKNNKVLKSLNAENQMLGKKLDQTVSKLNQVKNVLHVQNTKLKETESTNRLLLSKQGDFKTQITKYKKQVGELESDKQALLKDKSVLKDKVTVLEKENLTKGNRVDLREEINTWKDKSNAWELLHKDKEKLNNILQSQLKKCQQDLADMTTKQARKTDTKLVVDLSPIENLSVTCRPVKVAEEYTLLCNDQWLSAKMYIDKLRNCFPAGEEEKLQFLSDVLLTSQELAILMQTNTMENINNLVLNPLHISDTHRRHGVDPAYSTHKAGSARDKVSRTRPIPVDPRLGGDLLKQLNNTISQYLCSFAKSTDISPLVAAIQLDLFRNKSNIMTHIKDSSGKINDTFSEFIQASADIAWKIVNQRPRMKLESGPRGTTYDPSNQEINWGSDDPDTRNTVVVAWAYPALYNGDDVIVKGKVLLKPQ